MYMHIVYSEFVEFLKHREIKKPETYIDLKTTKMLYLTKSLSLLQLFKQILSKQASESVSNSFLNLNKQCGMMRLLVMEHHPDNLVIN